MPVKTSDSKVRLGMRCGECLHYNCSSKYEDVCSKLGVLSKANAPDCFYPNFNLLNTLKSPSIASELGSMVKTLKPSQLRVLAHTLVKSASMLEKQGVRFGQPVWFSLGRDFLSHYFKGYVIGFERVTETDKNGKTIRHDLIVVSSTLKKSKESTIAHFMRSSILVSSEWKSHKAKLIAEGKIFMDDLDRARCKDTPLPERMDKSGRLISEKKNKEVEKYFDSIEIPTIDKAPVEWQARQNARMKKRLKRTSVSAHSKRASSQRGKVHYTDEGIFYKSSRD